MGPHQIIKKHAPKHNKHAPKHNKHTKEELSVFSFSVYHWNPGLDMTERVRGGKSWEFLHHIQKCNHVDKPIFFAWKSNAMQQINSVPA